MILVASASLSRAGWGDFAAVPVVLILWLPYFLLLDRAVVLERCGFRCKQCGYDLRGQLTARCPECGREFDSTEIAQMKLPDASRLVQGQTRRRGYLGRILLVVLVVALAATLILQLVLLTRVKARRAAATSQPTAPALPAQIEETP